MKEMGKLSLEILSRASVIEGGVVRATQFLHLAGRDAVDKSLSRLVERGQLVRLGRGIYALPKETKFGSIVEVGESLRLGLETATGEKLSESGAMAALAIGLTTQVPIRDIYFSTGRSMTLKYKKARVEIKHAPQRISAISGKWGMAVRALASGFDSERDIHKLGEFVANSSVPSEIFALKGELRKKVMKIYGEATRVVAA